MFGIGWRSDDLYFNFIESNSKYDLKSELSDFHPTVAIAAAANVDCRVSISLTVPQHTFGEVRIWGHGSTMDGIKFRKYISL